MRLNSMFAAGAAVVALAGSAQAAVIAGPSLSSNGSGWTTTGIGFTALANATLTSFVYQNQGAADTIILTDGAGNVLDSINTSAGNTSQLVNVNWALSNGAAYWLLQTVVSNELFGGYGQALPSNSDIQITQSGTFAFSVSSAVTGNGWGANQYWAAFNDITTGAGGVAEPATWSIMILGAFGVGASLRRRRQVALAA